MLLSIVTPSFNRAEYVRSAVESVLNQDHDLVEHIVVDGGSTDRTLAILDGYPHLRIVSEPDEGIYDALNKGIALAEGEVVGFLNTDDRYETDIFGLVMEAFASDPAAPGVAGGARIFSDDQGRERTVAVHQDRSTKRMTLETITRSAPVINARFFRRAVLDEIGGFDLEFKVASDRDLLLRGWLRGIRFRPLEPVVYHYRAHEGSLTFGGEPASETTEEYLAICDRYLSAPGVPLAMRRELVRWRAQQIGRAVRRSLRHGNLSDAKSWASRGFKFDRAWPLRFLVNGLARQIQG